MNYDRNIIGHHASFTSKLLIVVAGLFSKGLSTPILAFYQILRHIARIRTR